MVQPDGATTITTTISKTMGMVLKFLPARPQRQHWGDQNGEDSSCQLSIY